MKLTLKNDIKQPKQIETPINKGSKLKKQLQADAIALANLQFKAIQMMDDPNCKLQSQTMRVLIWLKDPIYLINNPFIVYRKDGLYWVQPTFDPAPYTVEYKTIAEVLQHIIRSSK